MGYANAAVRLPFPELSEDPEGDLIWVVFRNPAVIPPAELASASQGDSGVDAAGNITDKDAAAATTHRMVAKLVIACNAYDARHQAEYDDNGDPKPGTDKAPKLPRTNLTEHDAAGLPGAIINAIMSKVGEANNPK